VKIEPNFYERLKRLQAQGKSDKGEEPVLKSEQRKQTLKLPDSLAAFGWRQLSEYVYTSSYSIVNPYRQLKLTPLFAPAAPSSTPTLCFYDTETTGLSSGAGTMVFLLGLGWIDEKNLTIEQYFLADFPGEQEFLKLLSSKLSEDFIYVSYNGSAFDRHILQTRYIMHGMQKKFPNQLDLLYLARSLWKSIIGACNLNHIEEKILDLKRKDDVPSSEIPELYFHYLRTGDPRHLKKVFPHNRQDILSLIHLYFKLQHIFSFPEQARNLDTLALGNLLLGRHHPAAENLLGTAFRSGNSRCGLLLSMHFKREGKWTAALALWQELYTRSRNLPAALELAKYWEHKEKNCLRALALVEELLVSGLPLDEEILKALRHRQRRLKQKTAEV
jgi:uncharacterized protein YprB with RNaseH-like and TPR domain